MEILIISTLSYLIGSIPFGFLLTKFFLKKDIRNIGSGNIGATNVLRTGNKSIGYATLTFDIVKAVIPIIYLKLNYNDYILIASLCIFLGHVFPIWLKFKGGKGIASLFGYLLAVNQVFFLICAGIWIFIAIASKYSSLASIISVVTMVFLFFIYEDNTNIVIPLSIAIIIIFKHKENIKKLINKKENKIKIL